MSDPFLFAFHVFQNLPGLFCCCFVWLNELIFSQVVNKFYYKREHNFTAVTKMGGEKIWKILFLYSSDSRDEPFFSHISLNFKSAWIFNSIPVITCSLFEVYLSFCFVFQFHHTAKAEGWRGHFYCLCTLPCFCFHYL